MTAPVVAYHDGTVTGWSSPLRAEGSRVAVLDDRARSVTDGGWASRNVAQGIETILGAVVSARCYWSAHPDRWGRDRTRMVALRVRMADGRMMAGRYGYDGGSAVVLREVKS